MDLNGVAYLYTYTPPGAPDPLVYSYDADRRLSRIGRPDGTAVDLAYDGAFRLAAMTTPDGTRAFSYDPTTGQVNGITDTSGVGLLYTYDLNGNRLSYTDVGGTITATYDAQDRLLIYGNTTYSLTANGDLMSKTSADQTTSYRYDSLGQLTAVTLPTRMQITYLADGESRRIGKKMNGALTQGFLYQDELRPIAELDGASNVVSQFVYASDANVPANMVRG